MNLLHDDSENIPKPRKLSQEVPGYDSVKTENKAIMTPKKRVGFFGDMDNSHYKFEILPNLEDIEEFPDADSEFEQEKNWLNQFAIDFLAGFATFFVVGVMCISMATTIFCTDVLKPHLGSGINMAALGVFMSGLYLAFRSKVPYMIGSPDLFLCPFFQLMAESMKVIEDEDAQRATFFATVIVATLLTGTALILSGKFQLLRFSEFVPYPVVCGLLAGIGVLLIRMGLQLAVQNLNIDGLICLLPGLGFGVMDSLFKLYGVAPTKGTLPLTVGSVILFYIVVNVMQLPRSFLEDHNYVYLSEQVSDAHFTALLPIVKQFGRIDWGTLVSCWNTTLVMIILVVLKASLMWPGCEKLFDIELNHADELSTLGWANLLGGAVGSFGATPILATMVMNQKMGGSLYCPGAIHLAFMAFFYFYSFEVVAFIPKFVFVGLLLSQGYCLVHSWLVLPFNRIPRQEWSVIIIINCFFLLIGMLPAVAIGAGFSVILFAYHFYAVGVLKSDGTGLTIRSGIDRSREEQEWLDTNGDCIRILQLQGFMFFGNSSQLYAHIRSIFQGSTADGLPVPKFLILDLPMMLGVDASAVDAFLRITKIAEEHHCRVFLSGSSKLVKRYLVKGASMPKNNQMRFFWDMDEALGVCEDTLLKDVVQRQEREGSSLHEKSTEYRFVYTMKKAGEKFNFDTSSMEDLSNYVTAIDLGPGDILFNQNHGSKIDYQKEGLYFIEHGFVTVQRDPTQTMSHRSKLSYLKSERNLARIRARNFRLTRLGPGYCIGSLELCSGYRSLGTYRADTQCRVYYLPFSKILELEETQPLLILHLYKLLGRMISYGYDKTKEKLANVTDTMYGVATPSQKTLVRTLSGFPMA